MQTFEEMTEFPRLHSCLCSKAAHNSNILLFLCKMCSREVIGLVLFFFFCPSLSSCKLLTQRKWSVPLDSDSPFLPGSPPGMAMGLEGIS